jgi:hypothetical protein
MPTRLLSPTASMIAFVISRPKRARFLMLPPYASVRKLETSCLRPSQHVTQHCELDKRSMRDKPELIHKVPVSRNIYVSKHPIPSTAITFDFNTHPFAP